MKNKTRQREELLEYIVAKLRAAGDTCEPKSKNLNLSGDFVSRYIKVAPSGIVLLCDRTYTKEDFEHCIRSAKKKFENVATVFLKDGETYFRAAMPKVVPKADGRSFKHYTHDDLSKMIELTPAEISWVDGTSGGKAFYYQPESSMLQQAIVEYSFQTRQFDYSHVTPDRFQPRNRTSKRIYQWVTKQEHTGPLKLDKRHLIFIAGEPRSIHACVDCRESEGGANP